MRQDGQEALQPLSTEVMDALISNYIRFLSYIERRAGSRAAAEEIVQSAFARAIEKGIPAEHPGGAVNWFYRVLRNALIDHYRRSATEARALETLAREGPTEGLDPEIRAEVCACFRRLLPTLKPEYADVLEKVDLEGRTASEVAREAGIAANNVHVRLFRARAALRERLRQSCGICAEHGCLECSCGGRVPSATSGPT